MNSRERLLSVMQGVKPDRVPVTIFIHDSGDFISELYPDIDPWDTPAYDLKIIEVQKQLGLDVFVRLMLFAEEGTTNPLSGVDITHQTEEWKITQESVKKGITEIKKTTIETPEGTLSHELSCSEVRKGTFLISVTKKPVNKPSDLDLIIKYEPKIPKSWGLYAKERIAKVRKAVGDDGIVGLWTPGGPFNAVADLVDHEELYTIFLTDSEYYEKLMNYVIEKNAQYIRALNETDLDVHCIGGNVAGGFLGKETYDKYILPYEKKFIEIVQEKSKPAIYHNCGQIMNLVESYKDLGAVAVESFSPPPLGDGDLSKAIDIIDDQYAILGNIDQVNLLHKGTIENVKSKTEETINIGKRSNRFILQTADYLSYGTPMENIEAYAKVALENADY